MRAKVDTNNKKITKGNKNDLHLIAKKKIIGITNTIKSGRNMMLKNSRKKAIFLFE
jgi:hypothetical protein